MILDDMTTTEVPNTAADSATHFIAEPVLAVGDSAPVPIPSACMATLAQLSAQIANTATLDAFVSVLEQGLTLCFRPIQIDIVWGLRELRQLGTQPHTITHPEEATRNKLQQGHPVVERLTPNSTICWVPLMAQSVFYGWIRMAEPALWDDHTLPMIVTLAGQSAATMAMHEALSRQAERLTQIQTLTTVGQQITGTLDLDELLAAIHAAARRVVDADEFYIALYDDEHMSLELAYLVHNNERRYLTERWPLRVGLAGVVIRQRLPILTDDYRAECARRNVPPYAIGGLQVGRAWVGVPLLARDRCVGVMTIATQRDHVKYPPEVVELLMAIAGQAAIAIENARLYRRSDQQARQLASLNQIGRVITSWLDIDQVPKAIVDQMTTLLNVEEGSLLLTDQETGELVFSYTTGPFGSKLIGQRLPRGSGIAGYVSSSGQSVIVNDVQRDGRFDATADRSTGYITRRLLAAPLRGVGGIVGVIEVLNRRDNSPFTDEDRRLLEALGDYAAIAVENARRFAQVDQQLARRAQELARINDQLQHNLRSLTALNALGMAITTSLRSPEDIYTMTTRGLVEMSNALAATVFVRQDEHWPASVTVGPVLSKDSTLELLLRRVADSGRPELLTGSLPPALAQIGGRAAVIVPLRAPRDTLGCLVVVYAEELPNASDRETIALFATQAAGAVESIALLNAVRTARDQMASILSSTREGILLIGPDGRAALANTRLNELCGLTSSATMPGTTIQQLLQHWGQQTAFGHDEWNALQRGLMSVIAREQTFISGELNDQRSGLSLEWAAITALSSGDSHGGALLVLRDITAAKESEKLRQDLTHMIVHDLRSPLSSVIASIDMMMRGVTGDLNDSQQHVLTIAGDSAQQMLSMINTLLDISRLEAGRMPLNIDQINLCTIIQKAADQLSSLASERKITIYTEFDPDIPHTRADGNLIVRVVQNLIANAIKFSGRGAVVRVAAEVTEEGTVVQVRDQGIGIAPKDREKIFTKFGQVGERRGGTGLGLTFCKLVIEAHGGRVWVESQLGEGSTFFFVLPQR
ncbi:MAG: hypothetical protein Fur005_33280 [Roseiflexaceae bacterium]